MEKTKSWDEWLEEQKTRWNRVKISLVIIVVLALIALIALGVHSCMRQTETVTTETQTEAETPVGVERAAEQEHVDITPKQSQEAAKEIRYIYTHDVKPVYTVVTTGAEAEKQSKTARTAAGADFSIVTDKNTKDKVVNLREIPADSQVQLNQYNVRAYKKELHTIEVSPDIDGDGKAGVAEIGYVEQHKVTNDGKYIGFGVSYNIDEHKALAKATFTW